MSAKVSQEQAGTGTVVRTIRMLAAFADNGGEMSIKQLASELQLAPSTVHRLLILLRSQDIVEANPQTRGYSPGPNFYRIASRVVSSSSIPHLALPYMSYLATTYNETVLLGLYLRELNSVSFAARVDGTQILQYRIDMNKPLTLLWGASGRVVLAHLPESKVEDILARGAPSPATAEPLPSLATLMGELKQVARQGYCISDGSRLAGARGVAAPVFGPTGVIGCLILTSPRERLPHGGLRRISHAMVKAADDLSIALGADPTREIG